MADVKVKIAADGAKQFKSDLSDIVAQSKLLDSELKLVSSSFDKTTSAQKKAAAENKVLTKQIETQKSKIDLLKDEIARASAKYGENDKYVVKLKTDLNKAETALNGMEQKVKANGNAFTRFGDKIKGLVSSFKEGEKGALSFGDVLKANIVGDLITSGIKAASSALVDFGKQAIESFGELEQNIGGSEAVFGRYAGYLQRTGEDAYKTMGTTQSEYLATANKMGALFQGSGVSVEKSVEYTTKAMQRAADMASVMGIDTESALEAITGAAKGNYTMMDNLGVAMNATTLSAYAMDKGFKTAFKDMSNADKAEVAMQYFFEQTSQYAGNFEREASQTVSGSIGMMQSAWQSLVAGIGNGNADIGKLMGNLGDSIKAVASNLLPVIQQIIANIPAILQQLVPMIMEAMPQIMETAGSLIDGLVNTLITLAPQLINGAAAIITQLANGLTANMDQIINTTMTLIGVIGNAIIQNLPQIIEAGIKLIAALVQGLLNAIPKIVAAIPQIIQSIKTSFSTVDWGEVGRNIIKGIANGLKNAGSAIVNAAKDAAKSALDAAKNFLGIHSPSTVFRDEVGKNMALGMAEGFQDFSPKKQIGRAINGITAAAAGSTSVSYGGTTINVYAQPGQSAQAIADAVADRINRQVNQRLNAWATV